MPSPVALGAIRNALNVINGVIQTALGAIDGVYAHFEHVLSADDLAGRPENAVKLVVPKLQLSSHPERNDAMSSVRTSLKSSLPMK
jgi:hypothetical protein